MKRKVVIISNTEWSIYNFRSELVHRLSKDGYEVIIVCGRQKSKHFFGEKFNVHHLSLNVTKGLISEIFNLISLWLILRRVKPDFVLSFTIKPNIYSSILKYFTIIP